MSTYREMVQHVRNNVHAIVVCEEQDDGDDLQFTDNERNSDETTRARTYQSDAVHRSRLDDEQDQAVVRSSGYPHTHSLHLNGVAPAVNVSYSVRYQATSLDTHQAL